MAMRLVSKKSKTWGLGARDKKVDIILKPANTFFV